MSDETEEGPDPSDLRRHAKKLYTELEYRKRYRRLDFYRPNKKQAEFHALNVPEKMFRAGNQLGKTHASAAEIAIHATQLYPDDWWHGRRFLEKPPIERPHDFLAWCASTTSIAVRDGIQTKLLGDIRQDGGLGTGLIPLDSIVGRPAMARGIDSFVDSVTIRREDGGRAIIRQKTGEQERRAFQGESVDAIWIDEDLGDGGESIYGECLARLVGTAGCILVSMTPILGLSPIRRRFKEKHIGTAEVQCTIDDVLASVGGHIADERRPTIEASYKLSERATRLFGHDMMGEGGVFEIPIERIKQRFDYREFPPYYRWLWGLDFRHSGNASGGHPFAAVLVCHTGSDGDKVYVVEAIRLHGLPETHVSRMKQHRYWRAPVAWPHDGGRGASIIDGETVAQVYKRHGLNMLPTHATFTAGGFNFEAGIADMEGRLASDRLVVAPHLAAWFDEYSGYHRKDGVVVKVDDDLLSATRIAVMAIRHAQNPDRFESFGGNPLARDPRMRYAKGTMNHPDGSYDLFGV